MKLPSRSGISLIEIIIAMTVFMILSTAGFVMVSNVARASQKVEMEEYLYTEVQAVLERITRTVQNSAIDYEDYYNRLVLGDLVSGHNYGEYHKLFFNPGSELLYGGLCTDGSDYVAADGCPDGTFPDITSFDYETGVNPYDGSGQTPDFANAFCVGAGDCSTNPDYHLIEGLTLINKSGDRKTIFTLENVNPFSYESLPGASISILELDGVDTDGNGLIDTWECADGYTCTELETEPDNYPDHYLASIVDIADGVRDDTNYFPITPINVTVEKLYFFISPIEDPFKGYNETDSDIFDSVQVQPKVTIVITARYQLFDDAGNPIDYEDTANFGDPPRITLQTTIGTGVYNEIPSYQFP